MKILRKALFAILASALLCGALAFAASAEEPTFGTEGDFSYSFYSDHAAVTQYVGSGGAAAIPETVHGVPVTAVDSTAFSTGSQNGGKVTSISIPRYLVNITHPFAADLDGVFFDCVGVTAYTVDPLNAAFCAVNGVLYNKDMTRLLAYPSASPVVAFTVPDGVRLARSVVFGNLEELTIGENVTQVPALGGKLRKISLPATFTFTTELMSSTTPFTNAASLEEIAVHPANPEYTVRDGVLFNKAVTTLIACPQKLNIGTYTLPNSVTTIAPRAFSGCTGLTGFAVSGGNPNDFSAQDGVLFNKDKTTLLCYPAGKPGSSYTLPNSVTACRLSSSKARSTTCAASSSSPPSPCPRWPTFGSCTCCIS